MIVREAPLELHPHACLVTGTDDGPVLDTGHSVSYDPYNPEFRVYLKLALIEQWAREHLDMVPRTELDEAKRKLRAYEKQLGGVREQATKKLEEVFA